MAEKTRSTHSSAVYLCLCYTLGRPNKAVSSGRIAERQKKPPVF